MFKTITLLKRRPGMTMEEFIAYYESTHSKLGVKFLSKSAAKYIRRFLHSVPNPVTGEAAESPYDVVMEIWFPDRAAFESTMASLGTPEIAKEIAEDEDRLFDRSKNRTFIVEEHESELIK